MALKMRPFKRKSVVAGQHSALTASRNERIIGYRNIKASSLIDVDVVS